MSTKDEQKVEKLQIGRIKAQMRKENPDLTEAELTQMATLKYKGDKVETPVVETVEEPVDQAEETVVEKPKKGKKEVSNEDIMAVIERQQQMIDQLEKELRAKTLNANVVMGGNEAFDDYLEKPINFFCHLHQFAIASYKVKGVEILPPLGRIIKFRHTSRSKTNVHSSRDARTINLCTFNCRSKKEAEYIRNCPDYGAVIFEKSGDALNVDIYEADMMKEASAEISGKSQHQIIEMAKAHDVPVSDNMDMMRRALVHKIGKQKLANFKLKSLKMAEQSGNELLEIKE